MIPPSPKNGLGLAVQSAVQGNPMSPIGDSQEARNELQLTLDESVNVSPEEQAQYDEFVTNAMTIMYEPEIASALVDRIQFDEDPVSGLTDAVVMVINKLQTSAEESGLVLDSDVVQHGALEVIEQLADMIEQLGGHAYSQKELEAATIRAFDTYREQLQSQGKLDPQSMEDDLMTLIDAENAGVLDQVLPGLPSTAGAL